MRCRGDGELLYYLFELKTRVTELGHERLTLKIVFYPQIFRVCIMFNRDDLRFPWSDMDLHW